MYNFLINKISKNIIPIFTSLYLISTVFNTPFQIKFGFFFTLFIFLIVKRNIFKFIFFNFHNYHHFLFFSIYCAISFIFINNDQKFYYNPHIINILALTIISIFLIYNKNLYSKVMKYTIYIVSPILVISLFYHYFIFKSSFLSASIFFYEFKNEDFATKNTLGFFLCLFIPYIIHMISIRPSFINVFILIIFSLSIYYIFSRAALLLYYTILIASIFSFKKKLVYTSLTIIFFTFILAVIFQITPAKYTYLKGLTNKHIYSDVRDYDENSFEFFTLNSDRVKHFTNALKVINDKPIFGYGLTKFYQNHFEYDNNNIIIRKPISHNDYIQILYEQGIVGIFLFFYLLFKVYYKIITDRKNKLKSVQIIQLLSISILLNFINLIDHALFWISLALLANSKNSQKKS